MTASCGVSAIRIRTWPAAGVNLMALSTRLISAWRSTSGSAHDRRRLSIDAQRLPLLFGEHRQMRRHIVGQRRRSTASRDSLACRVSARDSVSRRSTSDGQPIDLLEHAADDAAIRRFVAVAAQPHLADAANRRQRRPQLVRDVGR